MDPTTGLEQHYTSIKLGICCRSWLQDSSQSLCTPLQMPQIIPNFRHLGRPWQTLAPLIALNLLLGSLGKLNGPQLATWYGQKAVT